VDFRFGTTKQSQTINYKVCYHLLNNELYKYHYQIGQFELIIYSNMFLFKIKNTVRITDMNFLYGKGV